MISIITISLSIIVAAIVVYLLLEKLKIIGTDIINYNNGVIRIGDDNIHSETNLAGDIKLNPEKYPNGPLYVIDGKIMSGLHGHINMYKHPDPDGRTLYQEFLVFKLKYTVLQSGLIDVTDSPAGSGLPLITVKVPGLYLVSVTGVLRDFMEIGMVHFRIVEEDNVSNVYFYEDASYNYNNGFPINVVNRYIFIDKPVELRYGLIYTRNIVPYNHDIEFLMIKVA